MSKNIITQFKPSISIVAEEPGEYKTDSPEECVRFWSEVVETQGFFDNEKEHLIALILDTKYNLKGWNLISIGTINETIAHPREIFRPAIAMAASAFILMHNHPSGEPEPSKADHILTKRITEGAEILGIRLLDHIVIGKPLNGSKGYASFRELGVIF
jgi:DNA repair protein RadC